MVEQEAVNFEVAGSNPAVGAKKKVRPSGLAIFLYLIDLKQQYKYFE